MFPSKLLPKMLFYLSNIILLSLMYLVASSPSACFSHSPTLVVSHRPDLSILPHWSAEQAEKVRQFCLSQWSVVLGGCLELALSLFD